MGGWKITGEGACNSIHRVSGFPIVLEFLELLWIVFVTGNVLKKSTFPGFFWNCSWIQNFWQWSFYVTFPVAPCLDLLLVIKYYFNSTQGNLHNRPSHQVTVGPDWSWMSFSKLPYLLNAFWPIIATADHFPVFQNKRLWGRNCVIYGNVLFV